MVYVYVAYKGVSSRARGRRSLFIVCAVVVQQQQQYCNSVDACKVEVGTATQMVDSCHINASKSKCRSEMIIYINENDK